MSNKFQCKIKIPWYSIQKVINIRKKIAADNNVHLTKIASDIKNRTRTIKDKESFSTYRVSFSDIHKEYNFFEYPCCILLKENENTHFEWGMGMIKEYLDRENRIRDIYDQVSEFFIDKNVHADSFYCNNVVFYWDDKRKKLWSKARTRVHSGIKEYKVIFYE